MKRTFPAVLALFLTTAAFAAETQRYLVATRRPAMQAAMRQIEDIETRAVVPFETFNGFAADLTEADVASLRASGEVRWVEPVLERHAFAQERDLLRQIVPFGLNAIYARQAQLGRVEGVINVVVADTGLDYHHPELKDVFAGGRNVIANTDDPLDDDWHGTHIAGTIAAADNNIGVVGVAPNIRLWGVKVLNGHGAGTTEHVVKGLDWIAAKKDEVGGNWIVNLSLGAYTESPGEREAFQRIRDKGILVIAASGNLSTATVPAAVAFPAAYPSVISVGATTIDGQLAYFSGQGPELDFTAPGVEILSTVPVGRSDVSYVADGSTATIVQELIGSKKGVVSAEFVYCGFGKLDEFPSRVAGRIALLQRGGEITFAEKTRRAKAAGATAVAIFDNVPVPQGYWTLVQNDEDRAFDWPVTVRLSMQAGEALLAKGPHTITVAFTTDDYFASSGTSMSCPHVVGAAALVWSLAPEATAAQVMNALTVTATDLGDPGPDTRFGAGMVNAYAAARFLAPSAFSNITTGRTTGKRGRK